VHTIFARRTPVCACLLLTGWSDSAEIIVLLGRQFWREF
jgi:hypothetical protein